MTPQTVARREVNDHFTIDTKLPGLNQLIESAKKDPHVYARLKKKYTKLVIREIIRQNCVPYRPYDHVRISITYYEEGSDRDPDNINAAMKFICDAIEITGIVTDDNIHHISFGAIDFIPDFGSYKIEVRLYHD